MLVDDPLLAPGGVDRILIVNTWHHIPKRPSYVGKIANALKPGGAVWVIDFKMESPQGPPQKHRVSPVKVSEELQKAGLTVRVDSKMLPNQYIVIASKEPAS